MSRTEPPDVLATATVPRAEPAQARLAPVTPPDGDRLRRLVVDHYDFVWRTIIRFGVPRADAEDAAQQVFLVASRKLDDIDLDAEKSFLFQTARRLAWTARRPIRRRREDGEPATEHHDPTTPPDAELDRSRMRAAVHEVIDALDLELREVFMLYELEEMTMIEIARTLGLPAGTVASRLRRARAAFREGARRLATKGAIR